MERLNPGLPEGAVLFDKDKVSIFNSGMVIIGDTESFDGSLAFFPLLSDRDCVIKCIEAVSFRYGRRLTKATRQMHVIPMKYYHFINLCAGFSQLGLDPQRVERCAIEAAKLLHMAPVPESLGDFRDQLLSYIVVALKNKF